ncbi:acyltransferase family protein [Plantactinospora soyae]|uniref:Peptidoglycan/LPS O-acetylase OafA/YrhL n=1 Tax=Plantactinospora soyae TaxID=1544732 RepID=A0A927M285_9ACTN|nr:acyltransferase family protein [Plantactinospora soyae]MBE1485502.1 peptidoglycan/LPS O-acetylase OafA/YrhL [Plantactinospora soyae]
MTTSPDTVVTAAAVAGGAGDAPDSGSGSGGRDRYLDMWRAAALVRVVTYHVLGWIWLTVLFPAMGLMFALAGSLMASSLGRTGNSAVGRRLRRLLPPLWGFAAVAVTLLLVTGWRAAPTAALGWGEMVWWIFPARTPPVGGQSWAWAYNVVLWYIVTYLWLVLLSPVLLAVFRRWPWQSLALAIALPIAFRFNVVNVGGYFNEQATNVSAYLACWLLGFAHHDGLLRRIPARRYAIAVAALAVTGAAWVLVVGWSSGNYDLNRVAGGNTLWSMAFVATVLRFRPRLDWLGRIRPLDRLIELLNARAVTIYLWHLPAGVLSGALLAPVPVSGWVATVAVRLAGVWVLVAVAVALFGWIEDLAARRRPALVPARVSPARTRPSRVPAGSGAVESVPRKAVPRIAVAPGSGSGWHRAMASVVAVLAVGLAVMALNLWPGVTTRSPAQVARQEVTYHLSDLPMLVDGTSTPSSAPLSPTVAAAPGAVTVHGEVYPRAVLTAAPSRLRVQPPAGCGRLRAVIDVGADDAEVAFAVRADDVLVFESGVRSRSDQAEQIDVDVTRASFVDLVTSSPSGGAVGVWADPRFVCSP